MDDSKERLVTQESEEEGPYHSPFDYFNKDLDLLFINIYLEAFDSNTAELYFSSFFKGDYWDVGEVADEILDTNDYLSMPDMVLEQSIFILEDLRLGRVTSVGVDDLNKTLDDILVQVANIGSEKAVEEAPTYSTVIEQIFFLKGIQDEVYNRMDRKTFEDFSISFIKRYQNVFFTRDQGYFKKLQEIAIVRPDHILYKIVFDKKRARELKVALEEYLEDFANDKYKADEHLPSYKSVRLYFSLQLENFYRYIIKLNQVGNTVHVPFSILKESGFEAVKILSYLKTKGRITMLWSDEGFWKVQFLKTPITLDSLIHSDSSIISERSTAEIKYNLSFTEDTTVITFVDSEGASLDVRITGAAQKDVIRAFFKEPENTYQKWTMYDLSTVANREEKSVLNAIFQLNNKVKNKLPSIPKFIEYNQDYAHINPKYVVGN